MLTLRPCSSVGPVRFGLGLARVAVLAGIAASCPLLAVDPAGQQFSQEVAAQHPAIPGLPVNDVQLVDVGADGVVRCFAAGRWSAWDGEAWRPASGAESTAQLSSFSVPLEGGRLAPVDVPFEQVRQLLRRGSEVWVVTAEEVSRLESGILKASGWEGRHPVRQAALTRAGELVLATRGGVYRQAGSGWEPVRISDGRGRWWAAEEAQGVCVDRADRLWVACPAGVAVQEATGWRFFEGSDGLPWNEFTGLTAAPDGAVWMATQRGVIRYDGREWHYRQGRRWLPDDRARQIAVDGEGRAWIATAGGVGRMGWWPMTLAKKAEHYEAEIAQYVKRTPLGFVAEAPLRVAGDRSTANPQDSDNDGLWTAMYGAGECFGFAATGRQELKTRARQAFEALRFLQKVTQGGPHAPPKGYVARTVRPADWPDPNVGRLAGDKEARKGDALWKVYEPRWPRSADGKWYWKSDTSSDELDGHYFFYPLYFDFCADTDAERERVREVVRDLTDHLVAHGFSLVDHDGTPTRWGIYGPQDLNRDPRWWGERGLKSLSILSYLAVASHITGDLRYDSMARELVDQHGYGQNLMYPKVQHGPGSGNQSDDEMAVMCFYSFLRYSRDEALKAQVRYAFYRYWANEASEMNPFFHFAYAALCDGRSVTNTFGVFPLSPWPGWHADSMATLRGIPLDRLNWSLQNSHRLDIRLLPLQASVDLYEPRKGGRGYRVDGRVLPVENRHFNHWNTDPWDLDYGGHGQELGAGTVFLLPYYMGMYHGFIMKP